MVRVVCTRRVFRRFFEVVYRSLFGQQRNVSYGLRWTTSDRDMSLYTKWELATNDHALFRAATWFVRAIIFVSNTSDRIARNRNANTRACVTGIQYTYRVIRLPMARGHFRHKRTRNGISASRAIVRRGFRLPRHFPYRTCKQFSISTIQFASLIASFRFIVHHTLPTYEIPTFSVRRLRTVGRITERNLAAFRYRIKTLFTRLRNNL